MTRRSAITNSAINTAGLVIPIFLTLITAPLYIKYIGASRYGVLAIVWILLGYLGFMDLGLSRASENALGKLSSASSHERGRVIVTSAYLNLALGLVGSLIIYLGGKIALGMHLIVSPDLSDEFNSALPWVALMLPLSLLGGVGVGSIESRENFLTSNIISVANNLIGSMLPLAAALAIGPSLAVIVPAVFLAKLLNVGAIFYAVLRDEGPLSYRSFDRARGRALFGYGFWISVTNVISPVLTSVDQLLIGSILGSAAVTHYNIPMSLASRTQLIAVSLSKTLFPSLSRLDKAAAAILSHRSTQVLAYLEAAVCGPAIIMSDQFFRIWLGADFAVIASPVAKILMVGAWINSVAFLSFSLLQAQGRPDLVAKVHVIEALPFLAILWCLLTSYGLEGAAVAWCLRVLIDTILLLWLVDFRPRQYASLFPPGAMLIATYLVSTSQHLTLTSSVVVGSAVGLTILSTGAALNPSMRTLCFGITRRLFS